MASTSVQFRAVTISDLNGFYMTGIIMTNDGWRSHDFIDTDNELITSPNHVIVEILDNPIALRYFEYALHNNDGISVNEEWYPHEMVKRLVNTSDA